MLRVLLLVSVILTGISCRQNREQAYAGETFHHADSLIYEAPDTSRQYSEITSLDFAKATQVPTDSSQFYLITRPCAIMLFPDSVSIEQQKKEAGEDWDTIVDDTMYYMSLATEALDSTDITILGDLSYKRYLVFKGNKTTVLDNQKMGDLWAMILFNGKDEPVEWRGTDIRSAIDSIYHR